MIQSFGSSKSSEFFILDFLQKIPQQALDPSAAEKTLCEDIRTFTDSQACAIVLHNEAGEISTVTLTPSNKQELLNGTQLERVIHLSSHTASVKMWTQPAHEAIFSEVNISPVIFNILSMPLFSGLTRIGTLLLINIAIDADTVTLDPLLQTMDMIGKVIGLVLKNAYFHKETQEQSNLSKFMSEIVIILASSTSSLAVLLQKTVDAIVSYTAVYLARIWTLDEMENILELQASSGQHTHVDDSLSRIQVCKDIIYRIASEAVPHITNSPQTEPVFGDSEWVKLDGMKAFAGYPLLVEGRVAGVLAIFSKNILTQFTIDSLATVSYSIAISIKNKQIEKLRIQAKEEADRVKEEALLAKDVADKLKEDALLAKKEADRVKEEALLAKDVADRLKEDALLAKKEADRVKEEALLAKDVADRVKEEALLAKKEADRVKEEALLAKKEADRVKEEALLAKQEAEKAKAVAATAMVEVERAKEEALIAKGEAEKARKEADRANKSKSDFLSNMSHEIRTPMNAIIGMTDIVLERLTDEKQKEYLTIVKDSANSLLSIINGILDIMKIESGKFELETVDFYIKSVVISAFDMFTINAQRKGIILNYDISPEVPVVLKGDPNRLRQILINLMGNALKFTAKGSIDVSLTILDEKAQNKTVTLLFSIKDTGIGIATDRKEEIFQRFTQADSSTTRDYGGTGLGLTINKEIVNLMGGSMWVESEVGKGSTFYFTAVIQKTDKEYIATVEEGNVQNLHKLARPSRKFRILVAEDIEENILLLNIRLQQYGHTVLVARNGMEAVERFKADAVDVILMDVQMPVMDGLEATRQIRQLESTIGGRITIIALTASVMREEKASYIMKGVDAVVEKPIEIENLLSTIEHTVRAGIGEFNTDIIVENVTESVGMPLIAGVDTQKGMSVWKDVEAYKKALTGFSRKHCDVADKILSLIEANNIEEARRIVHSLDGVSGNLSMTYVFKVARELSRSLKEQNLDSAKVQLAQLRDLLRTVVDSINSIGTLKDELPYESITELDIPAVKGIILRLVESCEKDDPDEAETILLELHGVISGAQEESIGKYIEELDFDGAKEETIKLAVSLEIDVAA
ncbi:GAF domain-containing hybrid sensor histidine kinase/response regulator [Candidatus Magnetomonas plexicatena]|uniref:GAF domain-containing hybrid sensor histidine kinase/response regulator n=1 Tax=Candidatus Magnetomonas plexicatena TaxID=2552947 RepID=UPI001C78CAA6|nr:response regulator [Nitrospirales bacterium LBB_01]